MKDIKIQMLANGRNYMLTAEDANLIRKSIYCAIAKVEDKLEGYEENGLVILADPTKKEKYYGLCKQLDELNALYNVFLNITRE